MFNNKKIDRLLEIIITLERTVEGHSEKIKKMECSHSNEEFGYSLGLGMKQCLDCGKITYYTAQKERLKAEQKHLQKKIDTVTSEIKAWENYKGSEAKPRSK